jgi:hypothetical protein
MRMRSGSRSTRYHSPLMMLMLCVSRYPFVCAEILCSEVWSLCEAFFETVPYALSVNLIT